MTWTGIAHMKFQITVTVDVEVREDKICPQKALQLLSYTTKLKKTEKKTLWAYLWEVGLGSWK